MSKLWGLIEDIGVETDWEEYDSDLSTCQEVAESIVELHNSFYSVVDPQRHVHVKVRDESGNITRYIVTCEVSPTYYATAILDAEATT